MTIHKQVETLLKSYPELRLPENSNRVIRIIWADDNSIKAETILRAIRYIVNTKKIK